MKPLEERLRATKEIRLKGEGTDISFSVEGQTWIPCFGKRNIPDGELFSSPILDSVEGEISYAPSVYQGKPRSEEHTSELQSRGQLVCRLLLEKKNRTPST